MKNSSIFLKAFLMTASLLLACAGSTQAAGTIGVGSPGAGTAGALNTAPGGGLSGAPAGSGFGANTGLPTTNGTQTLNGNLNNNLNPTTTNNVAGLSPPAGPAPLAPLDNTGTVNEPAGSAIPTTTLPAPQIVEPDVGTPPGTTAGATTGSIAGDQAAGTAAYPDQAGVPNTPTTPP